jgi:cation diffusion facilitator family transporter
LRSVAIASGLTVFKLAVFYFTNSVAILASAADSFMDLVVSAANFALFRSSSKPPDDNHPYGHGKIESLAGIAQSLIIAGMIIGVAVMSVQRLLAPEPIVQPDAGLLIITVALLFNGWHARNLKKSAAETGSQLMATEYLHYRSDSLMYAGIIVSLVVTKTTGQLFWDPVISLVIISVLMKNVVGLFRETLSELLDTSLPEPMLQQIDSIVRNFHPNVIDYHDLRTRKVGPTKFIELHVVVKGIDGFREAHELTEKLGDQLKLHYPDSVITIHADPEGGR